MDMLSTPITLYETGSIYSLRLKAIHKRYGSHAYRRKINCSHWENQVLSYLCDMPKATLNLKPWYLTSPHVCTHLKHPLVKYALFEK